jgi:hypothetical protein
MTTKDEMTRGEREDLQRLVRQREKVLKAAPKQRSAELLADFADQLCSVYHYDDDEVWEEATRIAEAEVAKAQARVAARCAEFSIPKQFAPRLSVSWYSRGENGCKKRREELLLMARTKIEALERTAITQIALDCLEAQTEVARAGLTSEAAHAFFDKLPKIEALMPTLSFEAVAGKGEPPIVEQLISPGALRQRRYRERHSNAQVTSRNDSGEISALDKGDGKEPDR